MPKAPAPFDLALYDSLHAQGLSGRQIAARIGMPPASLRKRLKRLRAQQDGPPTQEGIPEVDVGVLQGDVGIPEVDVEMPMPGEKLPFQAILEASPARVGGLPESELAAVWPALRDMATWWQERQHLATAPDEKLERTTFHLRPSLVQAVRREADKTGVSYAAVVNAALEQYFQGRDT
jgi:predicted DNA binding CopG/RHH family protein